MSKKRFNTVEEITSWKNFELNGQLYDLSHLDAHEADYIEYKKDGSVFLINILSLIVFIVLLKKKVIKP
ncbi:MAG: hypothetical protein WAX77_02120 [Methylococcaceae bacterium]